MRFFLILLLTFNTLYGLSVDMQESYPEALQMAKKEEKPLLVYLYMLNCNTCDYMDREILLDKKVISYLNEYYVVVKLYINDRGLPPELEVEMAPVFHFINSQNGEMIESIIGGRSAKRFLKLLQSSYTDYLDENNQGL